MTLKAVQQKSKMTLQFALKSEASLYHWKATAAFSSAFRSGGAKSHVLWIHL